MQSIAAQTGGEAVSDGRELLPALARMSRDLDGYYVLTYQPSQATDGRFPSDRRSHYTEGRPDPRAIWILVAAQQRVADVARALVRAPGAVGTSSSAAQEPVDRHLVWIRAR